MIKKEYSIITYQSQKIVSWFVDELTTAHHTGNQNKEKALLALLEVFKLLGNSDYGKMIEALERQKNITYTMDEISIDRALRSTWFEDLDEIGSAYEIQN